MSYKMIEMDEIGEGEKGEHLRADLHDVELRLGGTSPSHHRKSSFISTTTSSIFQLSRDGHEAELSELLQRISVLDKINDLDEKKCSPLHYAVRYSHPGVAELLLRHKAEVNRKGSDKMTPWHYACRYGRNSLADSPRRNKHQDEDEDEDEDGPKTARTEVLDVLVKYGCDASMTDAYSLTGLHHAAMRGNLEVVKYIVNKFPEVINMIDIQGSTAVHIAATYGHVEAVRLLLDAGADLGLCCNDHQTPIHRAAQEGHFEVMEVLVEREEFQEIARKIDDDESSLLLLAVDGGSKEMVDLLLSNGLEYQVNMMNKEGEMPLHSAARTGAREMLEILVENGAEIDKKNFQQQTALYIGAQSGKLEVIQYLLDNDADSGIWDFERYTPIMAAAVDGHIQIVNAFIEHGSSLSSVDKDDHNILHIACLFNQPKVLEGLLSDGSCNFLLNGNNQFDESPLHIAARLGNAECVRVLVEHDADIDNKNEDEQTPCHLAASCGHPDVIRLILEKDGNAINDKDEDDNTPLHLAAEYQRPECLEVLLEYNAKVQDRNNKVWTPLDCAAASGSLRCVKILLDNDSPVDPLDKKNTTPLHLAAQNGHAKIVSLLLENGADITITNLRNENALEIAVYHGKRSVVEAILDSEDWRSALRTTSIIEDYRGNIVPNTPIRRLIRTFPDLAEKVFDLCITITTINKSKYSRNIKRTMELDFEFIDDAYNLTAASEGGEGKTTRFDCCDVDEEGAIIPFDTAYNSNGAIRMDNHPLMLMTEKKGRFLLLHPLCVALVRNKWKAFGRYIYYIQLVMYLCYLVSITSYTLLTLNEQTFPDNNTCYIKTTGRDQALLDSGKGGLQWVFRILVFVFSGVGILFEFQQLIRMQSRYFSLSNTVDWFLYVVSVCFVANIDIDIAFDRCCGPKCWQWPGGALILTLSWLNMLGYIRQLPYFGIYVIMFFDVLKTVMKLSLLMGVFVLAFGLGFNILLVQQPAFEDSGISVLKTLVMATGEFEFEGMFVDTLLPFPGATVFLFVVFVVVMGIIMMNLLVGLAVDDIKEVQDNAQLKKLAAQVKHILELEKVLPMSMVKRLTQNKINFDDNKQTAIFKLRDVVSKRNIWETMNEKENNVDEGTEVKGINNHLDSLREDVFEQMGNLRVDLAAQIGLLRQEITRLREVQQTNL